MANVTSCQKKRPATLPLIQREKVFLEDFKRVCNKGWQLGPLLGLGLLEGNHTNCC